MPPTDEPPKAASFPGETARLEADCERLRLENEHLLENLRLFEESQAEYVESYDLAPLPLITLDRVGTIRRVNQAGIRLFGLNPTGASLRSLVVAEDRRDLSHHLTLARSATDDCNCEVRLSPGGAEPFRVELRARGLSNETGVLRMAVLDLTDRDRAAEEMRRLVTLERTAREETLAKDKFIAALSHELRTPLTPVLAAASMMSVRKGVSPELTGVFEMIRRNIDIETRLIDDLLDMNRIIYGKMPLDLQPTDVHQVAREAIDLLKDDILLAGQSITVELDALQHWANADVARMRQVFVNLLRNSIKFTQAGGQICVRSWNGGGRLTVEVEDSGIGIAAESIPRLFGLFEQIEDSGKSPAAIQGLGLGLAICKALMDLQGGSISAASRGSNQGARFAIQIETLASAAIPVAQVTSAPVVLATTPPVESTKKPRILIVDDHADTLEVMAELIAELGFEVETAASVRSALDVDLSRVDLIMSDIGLSDGTGLELIRTIRARGNRRPAIAISGLGMASDLKASKEAGFDIHLTKPVDYQVLLDAFRSLNVMQQ